MSNFFGHFEHLCARNEECRREGVEDLICFLQSDSAHSTTYRNMTAFEYSLQRLVKGLSAYHASTLHGYTTSLACILDSVDTVKPYDVYAMIEKYLITPPNAKSSEAKGYKVGQLLAISAISRCVSFTDTDSNLKTQVLKLLLALFTRDPYLKIACTQLITDLISSLTQQEMKLVLPFIMTELGSSTIQECTPEKLAILFSICINYSSVKHANKLVKSCIHIPVLHSEEHLSAITDIILQSVTGTYLHPCITLSIEYFLTTEMFHSFWKMLVEEGMFEMDLKRKCITFDIFYHSIKCNPPISHVFSILSPSLLLLSRSAIQSDKEPLHTKCIATLNKIFYLIHSRLISPTTIILLELFSPQKMSLLYKEYKQAESTDISIRSEDTLIFIQSLFEYFLKGNILIPYPPVSVRPSDLPTPLLASQEYTLSLVMQLCKLNKGDYMTSLTVEAIIKFLTTHSFFVLHRSNKSFYPAKIVLDTELHQDVRTRCREVLFLFLTEFLTEDTRKLAYFSQLGFAVKWTLSMLDRPNYVTLYSDTDTDMIDLLKSVYPLTIELERELGAGEEVSRYRSNLASFIHYYSLLLLTDSSDNTKNSLHTLLLCYNTISTECASSLTEIVISTLSHNTHLSRTLADTLFRTIIPQITRDAILLLTDAAFDTEQTQDEDSQDTDSDKDSNNSISVESDSEDNTDNNTDISVEMRDLLFKKNVMEALDQGSDAESLDMDEDEERLKGIDIALSELFRQKKNDNPKRVERDRDISHLHFRIRVLSLIQMYIEKHTDSPLLIYLVVPVSECLINSSNNDKHKEFYSKLVSLFSKKLCTSKCKLDASADFMCVVLKREFHLAVSAPSVELAKLLSSGVGIVLKAMRRGDMLTECSVKLTDIVAECLNYFAEKKHGYQWNLPFLKLIEFAPLIACNLIPTLIQAINTNSYKFQTRKCEEILQCILLSSNSAPFLHTFIKHLHTFYTAKLSTVCSIENTNYCHNVLALALPYCQLLAKENTELSDYYYEETNQLIDQISSTDRIVKSQRLSRVCSSLANALTGSVRSSRRKRKRGGKDADNAKRIGVVS